MDARVKRLMILGLTEVDAEAAVKAGFDTPRKIKKAPKSKLRKKVWERFRGK